MTDADSSPEDLFVKGLAELDPTPDEDAWDAFVTLAVERIGGSEANALSNAQLAELEGAIGEALPFEIGLLLVMGVPDGDEWWSWQDPAADVSRWQTMVRDGLLASVVHGDLWSAEWGIRPDDDSEREAALLAALAQAAPLLPLHGYDAVPLGVARDETDTSANPILRIQGGRAVTVGVDLAGWLNNGFDVPLPMWPETAARYFPFWSELT